MTDTCMKETSVDLSCIDRIEVKDSVLRNIILQAVFKMHAQLCKLYQTNGYVPYFSGKQLLWLDQRKRGRSTFDILPTIFIGGETPIAIWWNRHMDERADVLTNVDLTLDDINRVEVIINSEIDNYCSVLQTLEHRCKKH